MSEIRQTCRINFTSVYALAARAIALAEVARLYHELFYNSMEFDPFVVERHLCCGTDAVFARAQCTEVFTSSWSDVAEQFKHLRGETRVSLRSPIKEKNQLKRSCDPPESFCDT